MHYYDTPARRFTHDKPVFAPPKDRFYNIDRAYSDGGADLFSSSGGITGYVWEAFVVDGGVMVRRSDGGGGGQTVVSTQAGIEQLDLAFDQNMRPVLAYTIGMASYIHHFDADTSSYAAILLPSDVRTPRVAFDKAREADIPQSDVVLGYTRAGNLCYRLQRERYNQEHILATDATKTLLWRLGRTKDGRVGFEWR